MLERHGQAWGLDLAEPVQLAAVLEPGEIGNVGMSFAAGLNVTGDGVSGRNYGDDFRMTIISGSLPPGLQLSLPSSEWTVTGTPTKAGTYPFIVQFTPTQDIAPNGGPTGAQQLTITIGAGPADYVATRAANGTWSPAAKLSTTTDGPIDVAIDDAGNALAIFGQMDVSGSNVTATLYTSKHPAGGTWSTPAVVSVPGDAASSPHVVADAAGTVVASWLDSTSGALNVLTSPSGGGFGPAATFAASAFGDLKIAPGHAVLSFRSVPIAPVSISGEPVS